MTRLRPLRCSLSLPSGARWRRPFRRQPFAAGILAGGAIAALLAAGCAGRGGGPAPAPEAAPVPAAVRPDTMPVLTADFVAGLEAGAPKLLDGSVLFTFVSRRARSVAVAGSFNGWLPSSHQLARREPAVASSPAGDTAGGHAAAAPPDSLWYALVPVARGRHSYKYLVDGSRWLPDPQNARQTGDGAGGVASVLVVP